MFIIYTTKATTTKTIYSACIIDLEIKNIKCMFSDTKLLLGTCKILERNRIVCKYFFVVLSTNFWKNSMTLTKISKFTLISKIMLKKSLK